MTMIKVPLQFHRSAIESSIGNEHRRRSEQVSAISAVENPLPAPCARNSVNAQKLALTALTALTPHLTSRNSSAINGTATALPTGGHR
ncbi:hypothetical protein PUR59_23640 [Streptomyces sp. SP18ES09]|uniref:hypothetical protein n=1 Tax=Streptomyces sp. SP18ES09 TaxID=3002532 RepID=UPI002E77A5A8|nr:hypothetical protein [Streptomyces sp. SP18ES09]MEE1818001.1 hypothetical protein [Streptomyces sp. SP18ES09]